MANSEFSTSLGTIEFVAHTNGWNEDPKLSYEVIGFPGGDSFAVSVAGQRETTRSVGMLLSSKADYETLASMRGLSGWLQIDDWDETSRPAMLTGCKPEPTIYSGGTVMVRGEFILL